MQLQPGTTLQGGKYRIERVLGQGGFGITYLATQDILDRQVAVKEFFFREYCERDADTSHVTLGTQSNKELVERFLQKFIKEARTISRLQHPGIIQIHDIFRENGTAYYVMEYIEGESLGDMVKRNGPLPQAKALEYIRQVGDALTYIHQRSINHLDVKPSNIMVRRDTGRTVLIDFGVAKQYDSETKEGTTTTPVGISHGYSPAEQYKKNGVQSFSPQSDVYALAATLFKLLTGNTPPEALDVQDMGLPVDELKARSVSPHIIEAIRQAMLSRSMRTQSVSEFIAALDRPVEIKAKPAEEATVITAEAVKPQAKAAEKPKTVETPKAQPVVTPKPSPAVQSNKQQEDIPVTPKSNNLMWVFIVIGVLIVGGIIYAVSSGGEDEEPEPVAEEVVTVKNQYITLGSLGACSYSGPVDSDGRADGRGTATWSDGRVYEGPFNHGVAEGDSATFTFGNGDIFVGTFKSNAFSHGRYTFKDNGDTFVGTFKDGEPTNDGKWYDKDGKAL